MELTLNVVHLEQTITRLRDIPEGGSFVLKGVPHMLPVQIMSVRERARMGRPYEGTLTAVRCQIGKMPKIVGLNCDIRVKPCDLDMVFTS